MGSHLILSMVIVLILVLCVVATAQQGFNITPTSVNATLGSTANFTCRTSTVVFHWKVNGSTAEFPSIAETRQGTTSMLHIPATEEYNNTNVTCSVYVGGETDFLDSDLVVLRVQGTPAAVSNLRSNNITIEQVIYLTWDAPFTLDITGVDPDISYCVDICVITNDTGSTPMATNCSVYTPEFNFTMDYPNTSTSVRYEFRVTPRNGAGDGPTSSPVYGFFRGPPKGISADMVEVNVGVNPLDVDLTISYEGAIPPGERPTHLIVLASTIDDNETNTHSCDVPFSDGMVFIRLNQSSCMPGLAHRRRYETIIVAENELGETTSTGEILFSTHGIQRFDANNCSTGGRINVSCTFAEDSRAMGYLSILCPKANPSQEMFVIANRSNSVSDDLDISVPGVPPDDYMVIVFDLESDGRPVESTLSDPYVRSAGERDNIEVTKPGGGEGDSVHVNGTLVEVPDPAMNPELQLCISFESNTGRDQIVVLAHHIDDPSRLSAYSSHDNWCFRTPPSGKYSVAVFVQNDGSPLEAPATPPMISMHTVPISSPIPTPPVTPTTTVPDPVPSQLGVIVAVMVVIVAALIAVCVGVAGIVVFMIKKKKYEKHDLEKPCERKNPGHSSPAAANPVYTPQSSLPSNNSSEEFSLYSGQLAGNGENEPLWRITADCGETETTGQISAKTSPTFTPDDLIKFPWSLPCTGLSVEHSNVPCRQASPQQMSGPVYADVNALPGKTKPPAQDNSKVHYSDILHQSVVTSSSVEPTPPPLPAKRHKTNDPPSSQRSSLNLDNLFTELYPMNSKWQKLGEMLGMDEDLLDEIFTNNERDEECLRVMLEMWVKKSMNPTWRTITDALEKIGEGKLAESLYLKCTLPGMVEPPLQPASPEPAAASAVAYVPDEGMNQADQKFQSLLVVEETSPEPSHYVQDLSLDRSQATSDEIKIGSAQKDLEEAHSDSESFTYADAINGDTTHPSIEETVNKDGEYSGTLRPVRICSEDSGILLEEARQEEGESGLPVSDELVSRKTEVELQSEAEQLQPKSALYKDFRGCTEECSSCDEVKVTRKSIEDLLTFQPITESTVTDKSSSVLVVGCAIPTPSGYDSQWTPVKLVYIAPRVLHCNLRHCPESECTCPDSGTGVASEFADAMVENTDKYFWLMENTRITKIVKGPGVPWNSAAMLLQLLEQRFKSWLKYVVKMATQMFNPIREYGTCA